MRVLFSFYCAFLFSLNPLVSQIFDFPVQCVGGSAEFKRVLKQEILYPDDDLVNNVGGKVLASFIVHPDGKIDSLKIIEGVSPKIDLEAKRLIQLCQWDPAILDGFKVSSFRVQKIVFKPSSYRKWNSERTYVPENDRPKKIYSMKDANPPAQFSSGGTLDNFIVRNLTYPEIAKSSGVEGIVEIRFVVETSGRITSVGIQKGIGAGCDEEALRVIRKTLWKPGFIDAKPARTQHFVPIQFKINNIESSKSFFD